MALHGFVIFDVSRVSWLLMLYRCDIREMASRLLFFVSNIRNAIRSCMAWNDKSIKKNNAMVMANAQIQIQNRVAVRLEIEWLNGYWPSYN